MPSDPALLGPTNPALIGPTTGAQLDDLGLGGGPVFKPPGRKFHSGGAIDEVNITAQVGEFMQPRRAVDHYGVDAMENIRNLAVPIERIKLHDGGPVGSAGGGSGAGASVFSPTIQVLAFTDLQRMEQHIQGSSDMKTFIIDVIGGAAHQVGIGG
jgi:hypothetical protein